MPDDKSRDADADEAWIDQTQQMGSPALASGAPPAAGVKFLCVGGPVTGREFPLAQVDLVIGRTPDNPISLNDSSVSRRHAQLRRTPAGWAVMNLSPRFATLVNGHALIGSEQRLLKGGDVITLGGSALMLVEPAPPPVEGENTLERGRTIVVGGESSAAITGALELRPGVDSPLEPDFENRTMLNLSGPPAGSASPAAPGSSRARSASGVPHPMDTTEPTGFPFPGLVPQEAPPASRAALVPMEERTFVPGSRGQRGPPSEYEVTDRGSATAVTAEDAPAPHELSEDFRPTGVHVSPEPTQNLKNPLDDDAAHGRGGRQIPSRREQRREAATRRSTLKLVALVFGALLFGAVPVVGYNFLRSEKAREEQQLRHARSRIDASFQQGKELMRRGRYDEARDRFLSLHAQDPAYPVQDFIDRAEQEAATQRLLGSARAALAQEHLSEAHGWLARVPEDSSQRPELLKLRGELESHARARVGAARAALDAGRRAEAVSITEDILKVFPEDRDATSVRADALVKPAGAEPAK